MSSKSDATANPPRKKSKKPNCAVPECPKQAQGRRHNYMCRAHYIQTRCEQGLDVCVRGSSSANRRSCAMEGCPKQSQGGRNNFMCRAHYLQTHQQLSLEVDTQSKRKRRCPPGQSTSNRANCNVDGCSKQSQGERNNFMCRSHFREWEEDSGVQSKQIKRKRPSTPGKSGSNQPPRCAVNDCPKQSQGGKNNFMCRAHFKEWEKQQQKEGEEQYEDKASV